MRFLLQDVGGRGEGRGADAAGRDVRRAVGRAVILGVLALWEAGVGRIVLERETHKEGCQADVGKGPPRLGLLCLSLSPHYYNKSSMRAFIKIKALGAFPRSRPPR